MRYAAFLFSSIIFEYTQEEEEEEEDEEDEVADRREGKEDEDKRKGRGREERSGTHVWCVTTYIKSSRIKLNQII